MRSTNSKPVRPGMEISTNRISGFSASIIARPARALVVEPATSTPSTLFSARTSRRTASISSSTTIARRAGISAL